MTDVTEAVRKLLALAESSNVHEAAAAARKAQRLMDEHNISMAELGEEKESVECAVFSVDGGLGAWKAALITGISKINGCLFFQARRGVWRMIGRRCDREVVEFLAIYLIREIQRAGERDYEAMYMGRRRSLKRARRFMKGFGAAAMYEILARMRGDRVEGSMALVVQRERANEEYAKAAGVELVTHRSDVRLDAMGMIAGRVAGRAIQWRGGMGSAGARAGVEAA